MENSVKCIITFLTESKRLYGILSSFRLSSQTVNVAYASIESRRKGYLDFGDIYGLFDRKLTKDSLYSIWKHLDADKDGVINQNDLQKVVSSPDGKYLNDSSQEAVFGLVEYLKQYLRLNQSLNETRKVLNFNGQILQLLYQLFSGRSNNLIYENLLCLLSEHKSWNSQLQLELRRYFPVKGSITVQDFINALQIVDSQDNSPSDQDNQSISSAKNSKVVSQIDRIKELDNSPLSSLKGSEVNYPPQFIQKGLSYSKSTANLIKPNTNTRQNHNFIVLDQSKYQQITGQYSTTSASTTIEKRREQLRRGSQQRQKVLNQYIQRKKSLGNLPTKSMNSSVYQQYSEVNSQHQNKIQVNQYKGVYNIENSKNEFQIKQGILDHKILKQMTEKYLNPNRNNQPGKLTLNKDFNQTSYKTQDRISAQINYPQSQFKNSATFGIFQSKESAISNFQEMKMKQSIAKNKRVTFNLGFDENSGEKYSNQPYLSNEMGLNQPYMGLNQPQSYNYAKLGSSKTALNLIPNGLESWAAKYQFEQQSNSRLLNGANYNDQQIPLKNSYYQSMQGMKYTGLSRQSKQNIFKRAEEEAALKIKEIERKARMRVLERKASTGMLK